MERQVLGLLFVYSPVTKKSPSAELISRYQQYRHNLSEQTDMPVWAKVQGSDRHVACCCERCRSGLGQWLEPAPRNQLCHLPALGPGRLRLTQLPHLQNGGDDDSTYCVPPVVGCTLRMAPATCKHQRNSCRIDVDAVTFRGGILIM